MLFYAFSINKKARIHKKVLFDITKTGNYSNFKPIKLYIFTHYNSNSQTDI